MAWKSSRVLSSISYLIFRLFQGSINIRKTNTMKQFKLLSGVGY